MTLWQSPQNERQKAAFSDVNILMTLHTGEQKSKTVYITGYILSLYTVLYMLRGPVTSVKGHEHQLDYSRGGSLNV